MVYLVTISAALATQYQMVRRCITKWTVKNVVQP